LILKHRDIKTFAVSSFKYELLLYFKRKEIETILLVGNDLLKQGIINVIKVLNFLKPDYLALPIAMLMQFGGFISLLLINILKMFGHKLIFWTVDDEKSLMKIIKHASFVITNEVEKINQIIVKSKP
jgi:hypothetical protein